MIFQEYLARLGIDTRSPHISHGTSYQTLGGDQSAGDISTLYNRLVGGAETGAMSDRHSLVSGNNSVYASRSGHPLSVTGSLSRWDCSHKRGVKIALFVCLGLSVLIWLQITKLSKVDTWDKDNSAVKLDQHIQAILIRFQNISWKLVLQSPVEPRVFAPF